MTPTGGRLRSLGATLTVIAAAVVIAWFGVGGGDLRSVVVVILVFGVPTAVAAAIVAVTARRGG